MSGPGLVTQFGNSGGAITALLSNFDVGLHLLKQEHQNWLGSNVVSKLRTGGSIWVAGLTSTTGSEGRNQILSDNRANSVVNFLTSRLGRNFPVKLEAKFSLGEAPARMSGSPDNFEDTLACRTRQCLGQADATTATPTSTCTGACMQSDSGR
jgi:outer membrane protein OmpA-like peptidoglycan-associated protein